MSRSSSSSTALRPCLKHGSAVTRDLDPQPASSTSANNNPFPFALCASVVGGPRVHFPPAPVLCQTHLTHSSSIYDRAPIVVLPNACALPARNERTYTPSSEYPTSPTSSPSSRRKRRSSSTTQASQAPAGAALHPLAFRDASASDPPACRQQQQPMPQLVPDLSSSESDESDVNTTLPDPTYFPSTGHPPISIVDGADSEAAVAALSFLPHAHEREKPRKEHRSHSRSRGSPRSSMRRSEFALPELDGCLGGF